MRLFLLWHSYPGLTHVVQHKHAQQMMIHYAAHPQVLLSTRWSLLFALLNYPVMPCRTSTADRGFL